MKVKILKIWEEKEQLRVEVESEYGIDNLGLSLDSKYLDDNGQPKWKNQVKELLNKKYGSRKKDKSLPKKDVFKDEWNKSLDLAKGGN